jgi:hypothetical protein
MGLITAWSYSRFSDYDKCPQLAKFKHVDKLKIEENDAMRGGSEAHEDAAAFIRGDHPGGEELRGWKHFANLFTQLRELEPLVEQQWGFTKDWKPTSWFGKSTWFRSVLDVCLVYEDNTADVVDHKTGKEYPSHAQQAELYAISVFLRYTQVQRVTVRFWYLDSGAESVFRFARSDAPEIIERWTKRVQRMLSDKILAPKPGEHCKWCDFAKSKGGPCKYG